MRSSIAISCALLLFLTPSAYAANSSLPKSDLYPIKRAAESAVLFLAPTAYKTRVALAFAKRRVVEIKSLMAQGRKDEAEALAKELLNNIEQMRPYTASANQKDLRQQVEALKSTVLSSLFGETKPAKRAALEKDGDEGLELETDVRGVDLTQAEASTAKKEEPVATASQISNSEEVTARSKPPILQWPPLRPQKRQLKLSRTRAGIPRNIKTKPRKIAARNQNPTTN